MIASHNLFYQFYLSALESLRKFSLKLDTVDSQVILNAEFKLIIQHGIDRRHENLPVVREFVVVMLNRSERDSRDIILFNKNTDGTLLTRFQYTFR